MSSDLSINSTGLLNTKQNADIKAVLDCLNSGLIKGIHHPDIISDLELWAKRFSEKKQTGHLAKLIADYLGASAEERTLKFESIKKQFHWMHVTNCSAIKSKISSPEDHEMDPVRGSAQSRMQASVRFSSNDYSRCRSKFIPSTVSSIEQFEDDHQESHFDDIQFGDDLIKDINNESNKIEDFVSQNIIPSYGNKFQANLEDSITSEGNLSDLRSFQSLYYLNPQKAVRKGLEIINSVSVEFRAEIVYYLAKEPSCRSFSIGLLSSAELPVKHAAIRGLSHSRWAGKIDFFTKLFEKTKHWQGLQWFFEKLNDSEIHSIIWDQIETGIAALDLKSRVFDDSCNYIILADLIQSLHSGFLREAHVDVFVGLTTNIESEIHARPTVDTKNLNSCYSKLLSSIINILTKSKEPSAKNFLSSLEVDIPTEAFVNYFVFCAESMGAKEFYHKFKHIFCDSLSDQDMKRKRILINLFEDAVEQEIDDNYQFKLSNLGEWDTNWESIGEKLIDLGSVAFAALIANTSSTSLACRLTIEIQDRMSDDPNYQKALLGLLKYDKVQFSECFLEEFSRMQRELIEPISPPDRRAHRSLINMIRLIPWVNDEAKWQVKLMGDRLQNPYNLLVTQALEK